MNGRTTRWRAEERGLLLSGLAGLTAAVVLACSGDSGASGAEPGDEDNTTVNDGGSATRDGGKTSANDGGSVTRSGASDASADDNGGEDNGGGTSVGDAGTAETDAGAAKLDAAITKADAGTVSMGSPTSCAQAGATTDNTAAVVTATNALLEALTPQQKTAIKYDKTLANAQQWSNFPTTFVQRNGVRIGDMSSAAQTAAVALAEVAAGATGSTLLSELREADEFLVSDGNSSSTDYGRGLYYFSVHGTPSTSAAWMLQIAGHHLAYNFTYGGKCTSATPLFDGVEPATWNDTSGKAHAPLETQRAAMTNLLSAISAKSEAKLNGTFSDLVNGPGGGGFPGAGGGGGDTKYPNLTYPTGTSGRGVLVSSLSADQQTLVKNAIEAWVKNASDPVATALLDSYESDQALAQTYVGYSGSPALTTQSSYVRIDGPRVWIEVTIQGGIVYRNKVHYHTIWRDKVADYGAEYSSP